MPKVSLIKGTRQRINEYVSGSTQVTTLSRVKAHGLGPLGIVNKSHSTEYLLIATLREAVGIAKTQIPDKFDRLNLLQQKGITPTGEVDYNMILKYRKMGIVPNMNAPKDSNEKNFALLLERNPENSEQFELAGLQLEVKNAILATNRIPDGEFEFLTKEEYFAVTGKTPFVTPSGTYETGWQDEQVLVKDPDDLLRLNKRGQEILKGNTKHPGLGTVAMALPIAGTASRAFKFAQANPDLVAKIKKLGGLDGLVDAGEKMELPPRFLYPIETSAGVQTLAGIMMENARTVGNEAGVITPFILMLNHLSAGLVTNTISREKSHWTDDEKEAVLMFGQSTAERMFISDLKSNTGHLDPTGHGDMPKLIAQYKLLDLLDDLGVKFLFFANGDEFLWGPDPTMVGILDELCAKGYAGMVFVVPNANNQSGGGAGKNPSTPEIKCLKESPVLPKSLSKENPRGVNTTMYGLSVKALKERQAALLQVEAALDVKTAERDGRIELVAGIESWAGTEFTRLNYKLAYVFATRPGMFLGIKTLEHTHSEKNPPELNPNLIPAEFNLHPAFSALTHESYIRHVANNYPSVVRALMAGSAAMAKKVFDAGYSYLVDVDSE